MHPFAKLVAELIVNHTTKASKKVQASVEAFIDALSIHTVVARDQTGSKFWNVSLSKHDASCVFNSGNNGAILFSAVIVKDAHTRRAFKIHSCHCACCKKEKKKKKKKTAYNFSQKSGEKFSGSEESERTEVVLLCDTFGWKRQAI